MSNTPSNNSSKLPILYRNWSVWLPLTLLTLTIAAIFYRLLFGEVLFWGLPSLQFYPWREFAISEIAQGRLPLWNPYNGAGAPLLANYQSALLYPPHWLYFLWAGPQMMGWLGMLHLVWAGLGMWYLTGKLECDTLGRGIAVLAYPLSNTLIARFGTFPMVDVAAWLPWLILAIDRLLDEVTTFRLLALAAVIAMQLLAGHAQWSFYSLLLATSYVFWRLLVERNAFPRRSTQHIAFALLIAITLAIGVSALQLFPTAELQSQSQRASGVDETFALNFSYPPLSLITLVNPYFFGNPGDGTYAVNGAYFEVAAYIGILPLTLALLGIGHLLNLRRRQRKLLLPQQVEPPNANLMPFFAIAAFIAFVLALGKFGVFPLLYRYVPTFNLFQAPARWLLIAVFSLTMLAALSTRLWKPDRRAKNRTRIMLIGGVSLIAAGIVAQMLLTKSTPITQQMIRGITVSGILLLATSLVFLTQPFDESRRTQWMISVLLFVAADLWWANAQSNPTVPASFYDKETTTSSVRGFWPDPDNQSLPDITFKDYLTLNDYNSAVRKQQDYRHSQLPDLNLLDRQPLLNNFDPLRPAGLERYTRLLNDTLSPALLQAAAVGKVYRQTGTEQALSRVWMVAEVIPVNTVDEAEAALKRPDWNPQRQAVIIGNPNIPSSDNAGTAQITSETSLDLTIEINSPDGGMLILADMYYPGWQAALDNQVVPIYRANLAFRGVSISPGKHVLKMSYHPDSFKIGLIISFISLIVCGILIGVRIASRQDILASSRL